MGKKPMRAALYLRTSTDQQTTANQRLELEQVCRQRQWNIVEVYEDSGVSGAKASRPAFDRMRRDADQGKIDVIVVWAIDRLGRSLASIATFMAETLERNVALYIFKQNVDGTTASGKAMLGMCAVFAEFERDMLADRVRAGLQRARDEGKTLGRPTVLDASIKKKILRGLAKGVGKVKLGRDLGVGTSTVQRLARDRKAAEKHIN
jgi:DNA invertase Pin-like site-specific DNA recombinase